MSLRPVSLSLLLVRLPLLVSPRVRHLALMGAFALVNLIHPLVHGTPIDGGMWDGLVSMLNAHASSSSCEAEHEPPPSAHESSGPLPATR